MQEDAPNTVLALLPLVTSRSFPDVIYKISLLQNCAGTCTQVEELSSLLNTGEVPNLFDASEMISIGETVRQRARTVRMDGSRTDLNSFFVDQVSAVQSLLKLLCPGEQCLQISSYSAPLAAYRFDNVFVWCYVSALLVIPSESGCGDFLPLSLARPLIGSLSGRMMP